MVSVFPLDLYDAAISDISNLLGPALVGHELERMKFNKCWKITDVNEKFR